MEQFKAVVVTAIYILIINSVTFSQSGDQTSKTTIIIPYHLDITFNKTTNLIFPYTIKSVDRGSRDILAQKVKGVENILLVKAGIENFTETNLSVITSDGKLYSFILNYSNNPSLLNISFTKDTSKEDIAPLLQFENNEKEMRVATEEISNLKKILHGVRAYNCGIKLQLNGIYIKNNTAFYKLRISNFSNIKFDIDMFRFSIIDEKKYKRTASQEIDLPPLYVYGDTSVVNGRSANTLVFALPKFTIPDNKFLSFQLSETSGGRNLQLRIHNHSIMKSRLLL